MSSSVASAISKFPPELLSTVFCLHFPHLDLSNPEVSPSKQSWVIRDLSLVCRFWKDIVNSTAILWTYILIDFDAQSTRTEMYLQRSKQLLLDVQVHVEPACFHFPEFNYCMEAVKAQNNRWRSIWIDGPAPEPVYLSPDNFKTIMPSDLPELIDAGIAVARDGPGFEPYVSAPKLRHVTYGATDGPAWDPHFTFVNSGLLKYCSVTEFSGWSERTEVEMWTELIHVLAKCPLLEELTIKSSREQMPRRNPLVPTSPWPVMSGLKTLAFDGCSHVGMNLLLNHLNTPNLEEAVVGRLGASGKPPANLTQMTLPRRTRFYGARLSTISRFAERIANREDVVLEVDLVDVLSLSIEPIDPDAREACGIPEGDENYERIIAHWEWMTSHGKVDWSLPYGQIVPGNDRRALGFIEYHLDAHTFLLKRRLGTLAGTWHVTFISSDGYPRTILVRRCPSECNIRASGCASAVVT